MGGQREREAEKQRQTERLAESGEEQTTRDGEILMRHTDSFTNCMIAESVWIMPRTDWWVQG